MPFFFRRRLLTLAARARPRTLTLPRRRHDYAACHAAYMSFALRCCHSRHALHAYYAMSPCRRHASFVDAFRQERFLSAMLMP